MSRQPDAFISAEVYECQAYLSTGVGKTWRVRFCDADGLPVMELLTPTQEQELFALRRRYPAGNSRVWQHTASKDEKAAFSITITNPGTGYTARPLFPGEEPMPSPYDEREKQK